MRDLSYGELGLLDCVLEQMSSGDSINPHTYSALCVSGADFFSLLQRMDQDCSTPSVKGCVCVV